MRRLARMPIARQLRYFLVLLLVLFPVVAASGVLSLHSQSYGVDVLTRVVGPAQDANASVL